MCFVWCVILIKTFSCFIDVVYFCVFCGFIDLVVCFCWFVCYCCVDTRLLFGLVVVWIDYSDCAALLE